MLELKLCTIQEQTDDDVKAGRVKIAMSAYEIHPTGDMTKFNKKGLHWEEQYTIDNMKSAIGAPFVVRFMDDERTMISDHGRMENDMEDGNVIFPDSDAVGHIEKVWIETKEIDGKERKVFMVEGVLYDQRYHELVKYLREALANGEHIKGSVEISGKGNSKQIVYEHGIGSCDSQGNLIIPRCPKSYDVSGLAILSDFVQPADNASEVIEINNKSTDSQSDDIETETQDNKEDNKAMDELNTKIAELSQQIVDLNAKIAEKDSELNKCKEELNACKETESELNSLLVEANKTVEAQKTQVTELNAEIEPLREMKANAEKAQAQAEVNAYFETVKENGFSEAEIKSLKEEFVDKCDLAGLKAKEMELCVAKFKEMKKVESAQAEVNSQDDDSNTLFFSTKAETVETNSTDDGANLFQ